MVKIAYCLLVHKNPKQVTRLLKNLYSDEDLFYVNVFNAISAKKIWEKQLKKLVNDNVFIIFKYRNAWAQFPCVQATLDSMKFFQNFEYDYFINLTGQCYPIKSNKTIKEFFGGKNFAYMEFFKVPKIGWGKCGGLERIKYSYYKNPIFVFYTYAINSFLRSKKLETRKFIKIPKLKRLPYNLKPYGGSAYFCITKKHVSYLLKYLNDKTDLIKFFTRVFAPDELFFQTILLNSELKKTIVNNNLRYIRWSEDGRTPCTLTFKDKDALLSSPALFARKFDIDVDESILNLLDVCRNEY